MPIRWVITPVVTVDGARKAKVATLKDLGQPYLRDHVDGDPDTPLDPPVVDYKPFAHSAVGDLDRDTCMCFVRYANAETMNDDPEIINVLEHDYEDRDLFLASAPREQNWTSPRKQRLKTLCESLFGAGTFVDVTLSARPPLDEYQPFWKFLAVFGSGFKSAPWTPQGTWVR